jgi:zinc transporter, ZIP family
MEASIGSVFLAAFITALVTGLGAVPFLFVHHISAWWLSVANGAAAGLMLGASHNLIAEGTKLDAGRMLLGIVAGLIAIVAANGLIRRRRMGPLCRSVSGLRPVPSLGWFSPTSSRTP